MANYWMSPPKPRDLRLLAWWAGTHSPLNLPDLAATLEAARIHCRMRPERFEGLLEAFAPWLTAYVSERLQRRRNGLPASPRLQPVWLAKYRRQLAPKRAKAKKASPWFTDWMFQRLIKSREIEDPALRVATLNGLMARIMSRALPDAFGGDPGLQAWLAFDKKDLRPAERRQLIEAAQEEIHQNVA